MARWVFFILHFACGFAILWLFYLLAHYSLFPRDDTPLWLQGIVETAYLVSGVVWGSIGWDAFKRMPDNASFSLLVYVLSRTIAPVAICLPLLLVPLSIFFQGHYISWRLALNWQNGLLLAIAFLVLISQMAYRKSEKGFFYAAWRA